MLNRNDNYETPSYLADWAVQYALSQINIDHPNFYLMEPGCGARAPFANAGSKKGGYVTAFERRVVVDKNPIIGKSGFKMFEQGVDFLDLEQMKKYTLETYPNGFDVIATNPPFSKAEEFIWESFKYLKPMGIMIFLLKIAFLSSLKRQKLYAERPPHEIWVFQRRPSFSYDGKTDMTEYGFFVWLGEERTNLIKKYSGIDHTLLKWLDNKKLEKEYLDGLKD